LKWSVIFLTFGHKFTDPAAYVREIPPIISRRLARVNEESAMRVVYKPAIGEVVTAFSDTNPATGIPIP